MDEVAAPLRIASRFDLSRNLLPIYNSTQLLWVLGIVGAGGLLLTLLGHASAGGIGGGLAGIFAVLFQDRPRMMFVSADQAAAIEAALGREGKYTFSPADGRWLPNNAHWWSHWPHYYIEVTTMDGRPCVFANAGAARRVKAFLEYHGAA